MYLQKFTLIDLISAIHCVEKDYMESTIDEISQNSVNLSTIPQVLALQNTFLTHEEYETLI